MGFPRSSAAGGLLSAAACALAAHGLLYRTLLPDDGAHGYFHWYEPAVTAASALSLLGLVVLLLVAAVSHTEGLAFAPFRRPAVPFGADFAKLFGSTLAVLLAQESVERSVAAGRLVLASSTPAGWLSLAAVAALAAFALAAARQLGRAAAQRLLGRPVPRRAGAAGMGQRWRVIVASVLRARPLAERFGLRAPPLLFA
jgi:hypothetical protein